MSLFRLEVRIADETVRKGTAWQVDTDLIVTAFHVVGEKGQWFHEGVPGAIYLLFVSEGETPALTPLAFDPNADIALLHVAAPLLTPSLPVRIAPIEQDCSWSAAGFPQLLSRADRDLAGRPFSLTGSISAVHAKGRKDDLQLTVDQGSDVSWEGASGSAVCVAGEVVGLLTEEVAKANSLYAAGVAPLVELLRRLGRLGRIAGSNDDQDLFWKVLETTRADGELLERSSPPGVESLAVSSFLKSSPRLDRVSGSWLLLWAARHGLHSVVTQLLKAGYAPDGRVDDFRPFFDLRDHEIAYFWPGGTALHWAAGRGSIPIMRQLIEAGAAIDALDRHNSTPLHRAAVLRENPLRRMLLWATAHERKFGELPPETNDQLALKAVRFLLTKGAKTAVCDRKGQLSAQLAADFPEMLESLLAKTSEGIQPALWTAAEHRCGPNIDLLVSRGADLNQPDQYGDSLLQQAIRRSSYLKDEDYRNGITKFVEHLLKCGADVGYQDPLGETALHTAVQFNAPAIVDALLAHNADPNLRNTREGRTPLFFAQSGQIARLLLSAGADAGIVDRFGFRALDHAMIFEHTEVLDLLTSLRLGPTDSTPVLKHIRTGEDVSVFSKMESHRLISTLDWDGDPIGFWAIHMQNPRGLRFLLDRGFPVDQQDQTGRTLLAQTLRSSIQLIEHPETFNEMVGLLRDRGADPSNDGRGFHCCFSGSGWWHNPQIAPWILADAKPDLRNEKGETLLMHAAIYGTLAQVQDLLHRGAEVDATEHEGRSALCHRVQFYVSKNDIVKLRLLFEAGADLNLRDQSGMTPLMIAAASGCEPMVSWLIENGADRELRDKSDRDAFDWAIQNTRLPILINMLRV